LTGARSARRALALATCLALVAPGSASAHGLVGRQDLPIPAWLFAWGAGVVLVASFVGLSVLWSTPRLQEVRERRVASIPRVVEVLAGALGIAAFVLVVYAGFAGTESPTANLAPTTIYVIFWVGIAFASALFGDLFRAINPWRAVGRATGWVARRVGGEAMPEPMTYPVRLGRWPAAAMILVFTWVELVSSNRDDPSLLAALALAYAGIQLVGMSLYGVETWCSRADGFGVYFGMFARLSPLHWRGGHLYVRRVLAGATTLDVVPGTVALLCVMIGSTSFDGFSQGVLWVDLAPHLQDLFASLGLNAEAALQCAFTVGLVAMVLVIAGFYRLGIAGMRSVGSGRTTRQLDAAFAHTLIPIALAYVVAHYFSLLAYQGQAIAALASDPLGKGSDVLGTATWGIDYGIIGANGIWYVQVGALVAGHVAGLVLAHDRALALYGQPQDATRSQLWMLVVMIGFTSLGLWLLSAAAQP
jgi:hypothetical protein